MLLKGPRGPGRFGGGGAPRGAGRWPEDILLEEVGLDGGDLLKGKDKGRHGNITHFVGQLIVPEITAMSF